ncbi:VanW family protein [Marinicrinis sediminis]|uniref:VanW family protein n=1 Tax=Marinicrinis sediminis TaxID=1652465 RepID=A0ABW5RBE0_9BACL
MSVFKWRAQVKWLLLGLLCITILAAGSLVGLTVYAHSPKLPKGMKLHGQVIDQLHVQQVREQLHHFNTTLEQRTFTLTLSHALYGTNLTVTGQELGLSVNVDAVMRELSLLTHGSIWQRARHRKHLEDTSHAFHIQWNSSILEAFWKRQFGEMEQEEPLPAKRVIDRYDRISYEPETIAWRIDRSSFKEQVRELLLQQLEQQPLQPPEIQEAISIPVQQFAPESTIQSLKNEQIEQKVSQYTTSYTRSSAGRVHNIEKTAATIDKMVLHPGDIFDYQEVIDLTRSTYGFREAPVIVNGKLVPGVGGGICQVSSTLYNAALLYGLEVIERQPHSLPVSYVPLGQDATFASGSINFRIRNQTHSSVLIHTETADKKLTVKLFGKRDPAVRYHIRSEIVNTLPPPDKFVYQSSLGKGQSRVLSQGKTGYEVQTTRDLFRQGNLVSSTLISKDRYAPKPRLVAVGEQPKSSSRSPAQKQNKPIVEDGILGPVFISQP